METSEPYFKIISNDKVINLTGETNSNKSSFSNKYKQYENYIVIDTDKAIYNINEAIDNDLEIGNYLINKYGEIKDNFINDFDKYYQAILDFYRDSKKILVIDSAHFIYLKDISLLKGQIIVMKSNNKLFADFIKKVDTL